MAANIHISALSNYSQCVCVFSDKNNHFCGRIYTCLADVGSSSGCIMKAHVSTTNRSLLIHALSCMVLITQSVQTEAAFYDILRKQKTGFLREILWRSKNQTQEKAFMLKSADLFLNGKLISDAQSFIWVG